MHPARASLLCAVCAVCAVCAACQPSFDPPELLTGPRLLVAAAEPAEVGAGEKTTLTALHHPAGPATIEWAYCTKSTTSNSVAPTATDCITNETAPFLFPIGAGESVDFTMPMFADDQFGLPDSTAGVYLPVRVRLKTAEKTETGIFRLRFHLSRLPVPRNQNPKLLGVYAVPDGAPATGPTATPLDANIPFKWKPSAPLKLRTALADGSLESYATFSGDLMNPTIKTVTETIDFQWYADAATWGPPTTGPERPDTQLAFAPDKTPPPPGTKLNIYVIARDERGGAAWLHRVVELE